LYRYRRKVTWDFAAFSQLGRHANLQIYLIFSPAGCCPATSPFSSSEKGKTLIRTTGYLIFFFPADPVLLRG
jgi:hypothetical protein